MPAEPAAMIACCSNSTAGNIAFTDAETLRVAGAVTNLVGNITLNTTGIGSNLTLAAALGTPSNAVTLNAAGAINQTSGLITATTLTGNSTGVASMALGNAVADFGPWTDRGTGSSGLRFTDGETMTTAGAIRSTGPVTLSAIFDPDLNLTTNISGTAITLFANGNINQTAGAITGTSLVGTTELDAGGAITLNSAGHSIPGNMTLKSLNTAGNAVSSGAISFADSAALTVVSKGGLQTGVVTNGSATLAAGGTLTIAGDAAISADEIVLSTSGRSSTTPAAERSRRRGADAG